MRVPGRTVLEKQGIITEGELEDQVNWSSRAKSNGTTGVRASSITRGDSEGTSRSLHGAGRENYSRAIKAMINVGSPKMRGFEVLLRIEV
jgi:hypothetical protein